MTAAGIPGQRLEARQAHQKRGGSGQARERDSHRLRRGIPDREAVGNTCGCIFGKAAALNSHCLTHLQHQTRTNIGSGNSRQRSASD